MRSSPAPCINTSRWAWLSLRQGLSVGISYRLHTIGQQLARTNLRRRWSCHRLQWRHRQSQIGVGHNLGRVDLHLHAQTLALRACAIRRVEREQTRLQIRVALAGGGVYFLFAVEHIAPLRRIRRLGDRKVWSIARLWLQGLESWRCKTLRPTSVRFRRESFSRVTNWLALVIGL